MPREFEFDLAKSAGNLSKHGITLASAQDLWLDPNHIYLAAKSVSGEPRHAILARYQNEVWIAIFTYRGKKIRLISARRAKRKERARHLR